MNRRNFILGSTAAVVAGSGALLFARNASNTASLKQGRRLAMPNLIDATAEGAFALTAGPGQTEFFPGVPSGTAGFNQSYLGPVIRVRTGQTISATVKNRLPESAAFHWHGLLIPGKDDGGPHQPISPGNTWAPKLAIDQPPATVWYHAHTHGRTAEQVYSGLAGVILISDGQDRRRGLPADYGIDDLVLVIQDRRFDQAGRMVYSPSMMDRMTGFHGNRVLVNGMLEASASVPRSIVRLRLLNGSNARIYNLAFADRRTMHLIGTDSGLLPKPVSLERLRLAPAERAEILVDFSSGKPAMLIDDGYAMQGGMGGMGGMMGMMGRNQIPLEGASRNGESAPILAFAPDAALPAKVAEIPAIVDDSRPPSLGSPARKRFLSLDMMTGGSGGGMGGMGGIGMMGAMGIDGQPFDMRRIDQRVALGSVEQWTVRSTMQSHPFHIHGTRFRVLSENGKAPRAENSGWKDTVLVENEVELLMQFMHPASVHAPFMYHCHILEHEDAGMMGQFTVA